MATAVVCFEHCTRVIAAYQGGKSTAQANERSFKEQGQVEMSSKDSLECRFSRLMVISHYKRSKFNFEWTRNSSSLLVSVFPLEVSISRAQQ